MSIQAVGNDWKLQVNFLPAFHRVLKLAKSQPLVLFVVLAAWDSSWLRG